ncbi:suppressor of cytokine signaling 2 [Stegostoma tigrinum]|uniref:suppressor of cytokine signaling 2 n=1 Tax=Stegostoma tigrinum TaxID=3053191 RepID=UPI00286FDD0D|nr:suppressor of cytokine signaling 2 [Stegostoma tigrinum]
MQGARAESRTGRVGEDPISAALADLRSTGWYWGALQANKANEMLKEASEGTFLVRDSSHQDYFLTISVKTVLGPTNLRIEYRDGKFRLDSVILMRSKLQQFDSVVHLVEYYVGLCRTLQNSHCLAPQNRGIQLWLTKPFYTETPSLQHFCRITIHKATREIEELPLPTKLKEYLSEYKYQV